MFTLVHAPMNQRDVFVEMANAEDVPFFLRNCEKYNDYVLVPVEHKEKFTSARVFEYLLNQRGGTVSKPKPVKRPIVVTKPVVSAPKKKFRPAHWGEEWVDHYTSTKSFWEFSEITGKFGSMSIIDLDVAFTTVFLHDVIHEHSIHDCDRITARDATIAKRLMNNLKVAYLHASRPHVTKIHQVFTEVKEGLPFIAGYIYDTYIERENEERHEIQLSLKVNEGYDHIEEHLEAYMDVDTIIKSLLLEK